MLLEGISVCHEQYVVTTPKMYYKTAVVVLGRTITFPKFGFASPFPNLFKTKQKFKFQVIINTIFYLFLCVIHCSIFLCPLIYIIHYRILLFC